MDTRFLLQMEQITKTFPGVLALQNASLQVGRGEIHALIGQNGAGKSTLIKILTGAYRRTSGSILFDGREIDFSAPYQAQANGISTIYQEVNLIPLRSVSENIFMGREPRYWGLINWVKMRRDASQLLERFGIEIDVSQPLYHYNIAIQQMVAVARAISFESKLVVMDEPTSSLDEPEVATLFKVMRQLKAEGVSVLFVSHRLDELYAVCDRVTIMRDGRTITNQAMSELPKLSLIELMLGKSLSSQSTTKMLSSQAPMHRKVVLQARKLQRERAVEAVDLEVQRGEIVGLAGLLGSGRTEVARMLFGADQVDSGDLLITDQPMYFQSPRDAIQQGIGFCSEDRKVEGIIPYLSVRDNLSLALLPTLTRYGIIDRQRQQAIVEQFIQRLRIKTAGPDQPIRELSGGNQQKVLLARWLCLNPQVLILDEPTRGIDIGAKGEIERLIEEFAEAGLGVVLIASELEELIKSSDRVVVLRDGQSVAMLEHDQLSTQAIMQAMAHGSQSTLAHSEADHG